MKTKILLIAVLLILSSCSYFRVIPESHYTAQSIKQYDANGKYLVLHRGEEAWHAYDLDIVNDSIHARLDFQLGYHVKYLDPKEKGLNEFHKKSEPEIISSIHIFTSDTTFNSFDTLVSIPVNSIIGVTSYSYAKAASRRSIWLPIICAPIAFLLLGGIAIVIQGGIM